MKRLEVNSRNATIILSVILVCAIVGFRIWVYLHPEMFKFTRTYHDPNLVNQTEKGK